MLDHDLAQTNAALAAEIRAKLKLRRATTLAGAMKEAGRQIPKPERAALQKLLQAEPLWPNPKLRRQLDHAGLEAAQTQLAEWLDSIGRAERRRDMLLNIAATLAFNVLVIGAGVVIYLRWTGWL